MRKPLLLTLFILLTFSNLFCQNRGIVYQESFDSELFPSGWSSTDNGASNWMIANSSNAGGDPYELQFAWTPPFEGLSRIITAPINLSGLTSASFSFKHCVDIYEAGSGLGTIGIATSVNNGNSWFTVWSQSFDTDGVYVAEGNFDTPDLGSDNVQICLFFEGSSNDINFWYFDDIIIESLNQNDIYLTSIDNHNYTLYGENEFSFTIKNIGSINIESFEASYTIDGETVSETFSTNLSPKESESYTFKTKKNLEIGSHNLKIEITSVNGSEDQNTTNNIAEKDIVASMSLAQRIPLIEHFSSSTCGPCVSVNSLMKEFTEDNSDRFTYVKYAMYWPGPGDPYYNDEGGIRKTFYNVQGAPSLYLDGIIDESSVITQEEFDIKAETPAIANIRGAFDTDGNTINITADFMSYVNLQNTRIFISINEKTTTENALPKEQGGNGETEFHHIMMKMDDANGKKTNIMAGEHQHIEFSYDMSSTNVEDIKDLEVALWLQDTETKEILNSHFAYEYTDHVFPVRNLMLEEDNRNLVVSWDAPQNEKATAYNIYINNVLKAENISELTYTFPLEETGMYTVEVVALYDDKTSVGVIKKIDAVLDINENKACSHNIYPNPAHEYVKISGDNIKTISVYNYLGIMTDRFSVDNDEFEINISEYKGGVYFINVEGEGISTTHKVIVL